MAISTFHTPIDGALLGQHFLVHCFLDSVDTIRPVLRRFSPTLDLPIVLDWLSGSCFPYLSSLSLQLLTWKVAFLVALTSGRRVGDIHAMSADPKRTFIKTGLALDFLILIAPRSIMLST